MAREENKRYKAVVAGKPYIIVGKESHYHMDIVNSLTNEQLDAIMKNTPQLTTEQAAVLLALNTISVQIKQQETILDLKKDISDLEDELEKMAALEERLEQIEARDREARKRLIQQGKALTEEEMLNQIEIQKIENEQVKEKIKRNHYEKQHNDLTNN